MANVQVRELPCLSIEEIRKHLPSNCKISNLEKLEVGRQKIDTVVIGEFSEIQRRKTPLAGRQPAIRFKLKGVLSDNSIGLRFDVVVFGKTVGLIDEALKSKGNSSLWIGFSNLLVVSYTGQEEPWCPNGLKAEDMEENNTNLKQEITLFYHRNKPKELPMKYSNLNDIKDKTRINVIVAVTSIIKQPVVLFNKTKHIMISIIDPSCLETSATYKDIPLHIFLNNANDCFPEPFVVGDILRIRDLLGDLFLNKQNERKMYGKIFHSKSVVKFKFSDDDDDKVIPISSNSTYVLTTQDEKIVRERRMWWLKHMENKENDFIDPLLLEKKICELTAPCTFTLSCLIKDVRVVKTHNVVILRVSDGTTSKVMITTVNFNDATMELSTQSEPVDKAILYSKEVDITVFEPLFEKASSLKPGDMVQLINVACLNILEGEEVLDSPLLELYMKDEKCEIRQVLEHTSISRELLRSLSGRSSSVSKECELIPLPSNVKEPNHSNAKVSNENTSSKGESKSSTPFLQMQEFNPRISSSPVRSPDKTIVEESPSPPSSPKLLLNINGSDYEKNVPYSALLEKVSLANSTNCNVTMFQNHERNGINPELKNKTITDVTESTHRLESCDTKAVENSNSKRKLCLEHSCLSEPPKKVSSCIWLNVEENSNSKRELCHEQSCLSEPPKKVTSYNWLNVEDCETIICNSFNIKSSLSDFCQKGNPDEKSRVWALLKNIHFSSREPCNKCIYTNCYHDWIWGLCSECGTAVSSSDLRMYYSESDLTTCKMLKCLFCPSNSTALEPTIVPFFKLKLCLEDLNNDKVFAVDLCGDNAVFFFGVEASFKWTIEPVSTSFHRRVSVFHHLNSYRPFQYCLVKYSKSDGSNCVQICDTKLNL